MRPPVGWIRSVTLLLAFACAAAVAPRGELTGSGLQDELDGVAARLARAWSDADLDALASLMAPEGISLHLDGQPHPALEVRQARAAVGDFMQGAGTGSARPVRARSLGGDRPRGLVELGWTPSGSLPVPTGYSVFLGLERREDGWRITEIRILR